MSSPKVKTEPVEATPTKVKRGRGRPKGSIKATPTILANTGSTNPVRPPSTRKRTKPQWLDDHHDDPEDEPTVPAKVKESSDPATEASVVVKTKSDPDFVRHHCRRCLRVLVSVSGLSKHLKEGRCDSWPLAGCKVEHEHQMLPVEARFPTVESALDWINSQELDQYFSTRESRDGYVSMNCINSIWTRPKRPPKVPRPGVKPRKTQSKRTELCFAKINISRSCFCACDKTSLQRTDVCRSWEEVYVLRGCLTHSHKIDPSKTRMSHATRGYIVNLLQQGHSVERVVAMCEEEKKSISAVNRKPITSRDVSNLQMLYVNERKANDTVVTTVEVDVPVTVTQVIEQHRTDSQHAEHDQQQQQQSVVLPAEFAADYQAIMAAAPGVPGEAVVLIGSDGQAFQVDQQTGRHEQVTVIHATPISGVDEGTAVVLQQGEEEQEQQQAGEATTVTIQEITPATTVQESGQSVVIEPKPEEDPLPSTQSQFDLDKDKMIKRLNEILAFLKGRGATEEEKAEYMDRIRPAVMGTCLPLNVFRAQRARNKELGVEKRGTRRKKNKSNAQVQVVAVGPVEEEK